MKTQSKLLIIALFIAFGTTAFAAVPMTLPAVDVPTVRILPADAGYLKLLYVSNNKETVTVQIMDANGAVFTDKVKVLPEDKGFLKFYDIHNLRSGEYWVVVSGDDMVTKYEVVHRQNKALWAKYWDSYLTPDSPVASM